MPRAGDLPDNVARWTVDPRRAALLIHDMQKYFVNFFRQGEPPVPNLIHNIGLLRERCTKLGVPIGYTAQPGGMTEQERGLLKDFWGPGMTIDAEHRAVVDELAPNPVDGMFTKWRYSAFHRSDLLDFLRSQGRDQLIICGVYAHVGCLMTACDAFTHDIETFLVADAVADFSWSYHQLALNYAAQRCARTPLTGTVLAELGGLDTGARQPAISSSAR
jgi:isochorismate hydrolase